jgi:vancomycin resistance protein YoaR
MSVSYVKPGLDATTFYPIVDLKFMNTTDGPVLVWTEVKGNKLTVSIYGSSQPPDVKIETEVKKTIPPKERIVYDKKLAKGRRVVELEGVPGYVVATYRVFHEDGGGKRRERLGVDEYKPRDRVVRVGY